MNYSTLLVALCIIAFCSCESQSPIEIQKSPLTVEDPPWLKSARKRIELYRMEDMVIKVKDRQGNSISNAEVQVEMTSHAFDFGSLLGDRRFEGLPNPEDAQRHLELVENYFNKVAAIRANDAVCDNALSWLNSRNIEVRGHYLMWARIQPGERRGQPEEMPEDKEVLREVAFEFIEEMITWAGDRISEWNLINHIVTTVNDHLGFDQLFGTEIFADVIHFARELAPPGVEMWVNEGRILPGSGNRQGKYYDVIQQLIELDAEPDGIGFMSHFKGEDDLVGMEEIYSRLDRFAELVPNLQLTELDIDVDDQNLHAAYLRDVMTIAFSHPAVSGIIVWQVWGSNPQNKTLWNPDWTIKPAGEAWIDLVYDQWWTDETGRTDGNGTFGIRGFLGDYQITVRVGDETKTIDSKLIPDGVNIDVIF